jgi:DMSO/TMAO reductase YedYZ molybdopterin-dependent catalytic subunit
MSTMMTRRDILKTGLTAASLAALGLPMGTLPAMAQGETLVPFTDIPDNVNFTVDPNSITRRLDIRTIDGPFTPRDKFFALQHLGQPKVDPAEYRLKVTGLVNKPMELTLDEIKKRPSLQLAAGFECSGNSPRAIEALVSNGMWTGIRLRDLLMAAGVRPEGKEVVFFGADHAEADVPFRGQTIKVDQHFGRSITIENAMKPEPILAYAMGGEPLTPYQGFPLRLLMPGWYGVCNVKWLSQIHVQDVRFLGNYQARWYLTLRSETVGGQEIWKETEVTHLQLKSVIARVTKAGNQHMVRGFVLNDGTPLKSVEVRVDDGPWKAATMDKSNTQYSWKLFSHLWEGATPGEHTLVSRVTDINGQVQPTAEELAKVKKTFLEDNSQFPRKVMIS